MKLIVGLGNPGKEYKLTRHNMGFMAVEQLAEEYSIKFRKNRRFKGMTGEGVAGKEKITLLMPQTFMNLSGHSVCSIVNWLKIEISNILLVVDDVALPFGTIRIRPKGSDAGHKGMRSVIDCLGTGDFPRMRIGIMGRPQIKDCSRYVLDRFTKKEQKALPKILNRSSHACECWLKESIGRAMNKFNGG
ncbi:MAG: aminoacyl-tRNA hydrolase [Candidatus Omnitrophica bacterium]|nr:aminoacyl-tRNA hydrolase [Candidatus Omnitrophota bacterium]